MIVSRDVFAFRSSPAVYDVTVLGGGLCGKAASLQLASAGLRVACIEPEDAMRQAVGESLDWSAPDLLKALRSADRQIGDGASGHLEAPRDVEIARRRVRALCSGRVAG